MKSIASPLFALVLVCGALSSPAIQAQTGGVATQAAARQADEFARQAESVKALRQALLRITEKDPGAKKELLARVDKTVEAAHAAAAAGRMAEARLMLDEAYIGIKSAVVETLRSRAAATATPAAAPATAGERDKAAYAERLDSARALRDALARIAKEKNDAAGAAEVATIDRLFKQSDDLVVAGNVRYGRAVLDHAYLRAKVHIERLRRGDTLVRTLQFESAEDEYRYEMDRNDTYQMLLRVLAAEGSQSDNKIESFVAEARRLRTESDRQAQARQYDAAVKTLERSSTEYQKALRAAGVMLPG